MPTDGQSSETLKVELTSLVMELFSDRLQNDPPLDVLAYLRGQVERLTAGSMEPAALEPAPSYLADVLADLGARAQHFAETGSTIMGHPTGLTGLDELLGGLEAGRVTILQAAPGTGKTTFTNQIGYHVAAHTSAPVLYVSFENDPRDLTLKTLCRLAGVSVSQAAKGLIQPSVLGEAARTFQARGKTLYYVAGNGATTLESIRGTVESIIRRHPEAAHPVVIIDYLQQLARAAAGGGRGEDLFSMISRISGQLSSLAQSTQAHIWAISSMNRAGYANGAKGGLASGKGSGDIEFDAAHVLTLNADEKNQPPDSNTDRLALSLVKNRYGAMGNISLGRDRTTLRIAQIDTRGPNLSSSMGDRVRSNGGR